MLAGAYLFPPIHDIRHLPDDSISHILLCKESNSGMISEEIYMIGLYFHKLNQLYFYSEIQSFLRTVMTQCFLFSNVGSNLLLKRPKQAFHHRVQVHAGFVHGKIWMPVGSPHPNTFSDGVRRNVFKTNIRWGNLLHNKRRASKFCRPHSTLLLLV